MIENKKTLKQVISFCFVCFSLCMIVPKAGAHELPDGHAHNDGVHFERPKQNLSVSLQKNTVCDALEECQELAEKGNVQAQEVVAIFYLEGKETPVNTMLAKYWLEQALENGATNPAISFILGDLYLRGDGIEKDTQKGVDLTTRAATLGSLQAQLYVWKAFFFGRDGFPQDYDKATQYLEQLKRDYPETNKTKKIDVFLCMTKKKTASGVELKSCIDEVGVN